MIKLISFIVIGGFVLMFSLNGKKYEYDNYGPKLKFEEFFNGKVKAWGIIQDWRGKVTTRFKIDMIGTWEGNEGKLDEEFIFNDGKKMNRTWFVKKVAEDSYKGKASDVIGVADGKSSGFSINYNYYMDITVEDGSTYRLFMDDWMWLIDNKTLMNRTKMKKWGITVSELTIFMQKPD